MATPTHEPRIDEVVVTRDHALGRARVFLPATPPERTATLGRAFGFAELNLPRTPELDTLLAGVESELERAYRSGTLRPGETAELFFENAVRKVENGMREFAQKRKFRLDPENTNLLFGCLTGDQVFLSTHGRVHAYLIRRAPEKPPRVVDILRGIEEGDAGSGERRLLGSMITGALAPRDSILVMNGTLHDAVPVADFVKHIERTDEAGFSAQLRSLALAARPAGTSVGIILRMAPVRHLIPPTEDVSVKKLLSREEEVARVLRPAGVPELKPLIGRLTKPPEGVGKRERAPHAPPAPRLGPIERFNRLPHRTKIGGIVILALIAILLVGVRIADHRNRTAAIREAYRNAVDGIERRIDDAEASIIFDEVRARELAQEARTALAALPAANARDSELSTALDETLTALERRLEHIFDVTPRGLGTLSGAGAILASRGGRLYASAGAELVRIESDGRMQSIATLAAPPIWSADDGNALLLYLENGTLVSVEPDKGLPRSLAYDGPTGPRGASTWNGNLYVLTSDGRQIWRLPPTLTGFGRGAKWLAEDLTGEGATALAIDGNIYTAIAGDAVRGWSRGRPLPVAASGGSAVSRVRHLTLTDRGIYALGTDGSLSAWNRDGKLLAQYVVPAGNGMVHAVFVDERTKTVTATTDSGTVLVFDLSHLK